MQAKVYICKEQQRIMKRIVSIIAVLVALVAGFSSCSKKDKGPLMTFKPGASYTIEDNVLARTSTTYKIGITAAPGNGDFLLGSFKLKRKYNDDNEEVLETQTIIGAQQYSYDRDFNFTTRAQVGVELYTFEITDKDGKTKTLSIKLTTH
jgi:hypothetical protein